MIHMKDGSLVIEANGYGAKDIEHLLKTCAGVTVIDTQPQDKETKAIESYAADHIEDQKNLLADAARSTRYKSPT